jgi:GTP-binding protein
MFVDRAKIFVKSGSGGDGTVSFRREKYVPRGGPDGGDGGRGGSVYLEGTHGQNTLLGFRYRPRYVAPDGRPGGGRKRTGASGEDLIVYCPVGTQARRLPGMVLVADLDEDGRRVLVARGGRGGRGNVHFATPTRRTPRKATPGEPGEEFELQLELKLIADVGLAGMPNAGKSSILARLTNARPEVAAYPFTTLTPHLGVVELDRERAFVLADIPGLISGAGEGAGLGHDFLRHVERTRLVAVVVDAAGTEGRDPIEDYGVVLAELEAYSPALAKKVSLVIANKTDLPDAGKNLKRLRERLTGPVLPLSTVAGTGCTELVAHLARALEAEGLWVRKDGGDDEDRAYDPLA